MKLICVASLILLNYLIHRGKNSKNHQSEDSWKRIDAFLMEFNPISLNLIFGWRWESLQHFARWKSKVMYSMGRLMDESLIQIVLWRLESINILKIQLKIVLQIWKNRLKIKKVVKFCPYYDFRERISPTQFPIIWYLGEGYISPTNFLVVYDSKMMGNGILIPCRINLSYVHYSIYRY